ncbi:MAG: hypothetical protein PWP31_1405 [Clostridia bacterium]|nr:hypothetical protein [Clostridia bacterium]
MNLEELSQKGINRDDLIPKNILYHYKSGTGLIIYDTILMQK